MGCRATELFGCNDWSQVPKPESPCATNYRTHTLWSSHITTREKPACQNKETTCHNKRSRMPQLRPDTVKWISKERKKWSVWWDFSSLPTLRLLWGGGNGFQPEERLYWPKCCWVSDFNKLDPGLVFPLGARGVGRGCFPPFLLGNSNPSPNGRKEMWLKWLQKRNMTPALLNYA